MIRALLVDDDPHVLRSLERLLSWRRDDLEFFEAGDGEEAISVLRKNPIDVVVTDLHMPHLDGFDLAAWILSNQPHVLVFTMTAYPNEAGISRLQELGGVECFTKPLDASNLLSRLDNRLANDIRGHIRNIGIASLLQLIEMERKTCTLFVESVDESLNQNGRLYLDKGILVHAQYGSVEGESAAVVIAAWPSTSITIVSTCPSTQRTITNPLNYIIMEAFRLSDEAKTNELQSNEPVINDIDDAFADELFDDVFSEGIAKGVASDDTPISVKTNLIESPHQSDKFDTENLSKSFFISEGANAAAVVDVETGVVTTLAGSFDDLDAVAKLTTQVFAAEQAALASLSLDEAVEEMVLTTIRYSSLMRPIGDGNKMIAIVVFDPQHANLGLGRLELARFTAWLLESDVTADQFV